MTAVEAAPKPPAMPDGVRGDGTTLASRSGRRWRRSRLVIVGILVVVLVALLVARMTPEQSTVRFAPDNPGPNGGMALAEVLRDQGVEIVATDSIAEAIGAAGPGTTLLVANDYGMRADLADALLGTGATPVLVAPGTVLLSRATDQVAHARRSPDTRPAPAACTDPDALAAGAATSSGARFRAVAEAPSAIFCFPDDSGAGHYATFPLAPDPTITVRALDDATGLTNEQIRTAGNAALGLRMLGHHDRLVWLVPQRPVPAAEGSAASILPPWAGPVGAQLLVLVAVTALWRGRRLGRLVSEDLVVVTRSSETTTGRGRLYRRGRAHGHAGAALRAGAADRMAARLGLPRSTGPEALVDALSRVTHRPTPQVVDLLYGPPPADDVALTRLAHDLDELESEVHRA